MRVSDVFQVTLRRFGVWHGALACVAVCASAALVGWMVAQPDAPGVVAWTGAAAALVAILALAGSLRVRSALGLRFDGQTWHLDPVDTIGAEPLPGRLDVAIDLGAWMLLRWRADSGPRPRVVWLPVQRAGLEAQWHALRCAVHAPRPANADDASPVEV